VLDYTGMERLTLPKKYQKYNIILTK